MIGKPESATGSFLTAFILTLALLLPAAGLTRSSAMPWPKSDPLFYLRQNLAKVGCLLADGRIGWAAFADNASRRPRSRMEAGRTLGAIAWIGFGAESFLRARQF